MKVEVKIPSVGESVTEATVANILKSKGSQVKEGDEIIELETDKVNQIVYAPASGTLDLKVKVDDVVKVGQVIGTIDSEKGAAVSSLVSTKESTPPPSPKKAETGASLRSKEADYISDLKKKPEMPPAKFEKREERKEEKKEVSAKEPRQRRERMTKLRRVIGERLMEVKNQTAMLTTFNEVDLTNIIEMRKREQENFQKKHGVKLGFMSFFVKASVAALQAYPDINAFIDKDEIVYCDYYDISVAVSTEKGLMVPVLRDCDKLSFSDVERKLKEFAESARTGAISINDMKGGTFTITNGGVFGSLLSTPILNPPQSGILGMHAIQERPVAIQGKVEVRSMMYLALSYDHRIVDGKEAISFLVHMKKNLEDPSRLLLDI